MYKMDSVIKGVILRLWPSGNTVSLRPFSYGLFGGGHGQNSLEVISHHKRVLGFH